MMQRNISVPVTRRETGAKDDGGEGERNKMKGGVIPSPGSHGSATRQPRNMTNGRNGHGAHKGNISYNHKHLTGHRLGGYTFGTNVLGAVRERRGRSRSRP